MGEVKGRFLWNFMLTADFLVVLGKTGKGTIGGVVC